MSNREIRQLARIVADHTRQLSALNRPQLAHSAIEGGSIDSYDHDGNLRLRIGDQGDGTQTITVVDGPIPPAPSAPVVAVDGPVLTISWDGHLADPNLPLPADFARIHVHLAQTPDMSSAPVRASIEAKAGASTVTAVDQAGTWWVALAVEAQSGKRSPLSAPVEAVVSLVNLDGALEAVRESADGKNRNYYNPIEPSPDDDLAEGDLWFDTSEDEDGLTRYTPHRWDGQQWVSLEDERTQAIQDAQREFEQSTSQALSDVQQAASGAQSAADAAQETANTARSEATSKAQAAQQAAEAHAEAVAEAERLAAIAAASDDATAKAAAAEAAAIAAAALDAKTKADAAQAAAEARAQAAQDAADAAMDRANDAHSAAGKAADAADAALQAATHNAKNLWSTSDPSGTAPQGTIWFKIDPATKNVVGQWQQTAGSDTSFGSNWEKRSLTDALFDNIDAGKVGTGYLDVAKLIRAGAIQADKLMIESGANLLPDQAIAQATGFGSWSVVDGGLERTGTGAQSGSYWTQWSFEAVPGERIHGSFTQEADTPGTTSLYISWQMTPGGAWVSPHLVSQVSGAGYASGSTFVPSGALRGRIGLYVQNNVPSGAQKRVTGIRVRRMTGSTLIEDGAITTEKIATGAITAESGVIGSLDLGKATVGELDGARIKFGSASGDILKADALDGKVITGAVVQTSHDHPKTLLDPAGVHVTDEDGQDIVYLGRQIGVRGPSGETLAQISDDGTISGNALNIEEDPVYAGLPLLGAYQAYERPSRDGYTGWLDSLPRGVVARGRLNPDINVSRGVSNGVIGLMELQFQQEAGRQFKITVEPITVFVFDGGSARLVVRYTWDGSQPNSTSSNLADWQVRSSGGSPKYSLGGSFPHQGESTTTIRLLLCLEVFDGTAKLDDRSWSTRGRMLVEDIGPIVEDTTVDRLLKVENSVSSPEPPAPEKRNYTKRYWATAGRAFYTRGGYRTSNTDLVYQGDQPGMGGMRSMILFPSMTGDLSGAEITSMTMRIDFTHWYSSAGGDAKIQLHGLSSLPTSMPSMEHGWTEEKVPKPGQRVVKIPSRYWSRFKSGNVRGIGIGDTSPARAEYGYGRWARYYIEVKYRK